MTMAGRCLHGRYRLERRIAAGGMGEVWRARDEVLGRAVAVKILRSGYAGESSFLERFRAEARHAAALSHPGIAQVYDYGEDGGVPYLVMELVRGEPLSALLDRERRIDAARTLGLVHQAGLALASAHDAGLVHRDVKPGNLLVTPDGRVKVTDFGIARAADAVPLTQTGTILGTAYYLSPEQALGGPASPASDVYALGVVAYECLAGRRPFVGDHPVAVAVAHAHEEPPPLPGDVPAPVRDLVAACLAKDASMRPGTARALATRAAILADALDGEVPAALTGPATHGAGGGSPSDPDGAQVTAPGLPRRGVVPSTPSGSTSAGADGARRGRWPGRRVAAGTAALTVVLAGSTAARLSGDPSGADDTTAGPALAGAAQVTVRPGRYLGRPYPEVAGALRRLGLAVRRSDVATGGAPGTVVALDPSGSLLAGSVVTVSVVRSTGTAPAASSSGSPHVGSTSARANGQGGRDGRSVPEGRGGSGTGDGDDLRAPRGAGAPTEVPGGKDAGTPAGGKDGGSSKGNGGVGKGGGTKDGGGSPDKDGAPNGGGGKGGDGPPARSGAGSGRGQRHGRRRQARHHDDMDVRGVGRGGQDTEG